MNLNELLVELKDEYEKLVCVQNAMADTLPL